jgi:hypothetical protein
LALFAPSFHLWNEKQAPLDNLLLTSEQNLLTIILVSLGNGHINGIGHISDQLHAATAERPLAVDSFIKQLGCCRAVCHHLLADKPPILPSNASAQLGATNTSGRGAMAIWLPQ